jgi:hypothetical protein
MIKRLLPVPLGTAFFWILDFRCLTQDIFPFLLLAFAK